MSRVVGDGAPFGSPYDVVWTGTHFLVVATGEAGIVGRLLDGHGEPIGEPFRLVDGGGGPRVAFNGRHVLLLFGSAESPNLRALLLTPDGKPAEEAPRELGVVPQGRVAVASNGDSFAALLPRLWNPELLLFDSRGTLTSTAVFGDYGNGFAIASDGRRYLALGACDAYGPCAPVYARLIESDGTMGPPLELDPPIGRSPAVVWDGAGWVVAYTMDDGVPATLRVAHLFTHGPNERVIRRLDGEGKPIGDRIHVPDRLSVAQILWSGHDYLLISGSGTELTRMTPSGAFTATVPIPSIVNNSATFGTDGDGRLLAVWINRTIVNHQQRIESLSAVRVDRDLQPIDASPIKLSIDDQFVYAVSVGWDGRQYVVVWNGREGVMAAQLAASVPAGPRVSKIADGQAIRTSAVPVAGGAAILWNASSVNRVAFLLHDGSATTPLTMSNGPVQSFESDIVPLANGDLAYVDASRQEGPPFESTMRVMMRVVPATRLPAKPEAPRLAAHAGTPGEVVLTWDAPPQTVDGYRVEHRVDRGPWTEIPTTLAPETRELRFAVESGTSYVFRVRAWNEAGAGAYSNAVTTSRGRRRAVRR